MISEFDIVIPYGPSDKKVVDDMLKFTKKNVIGYRKIFIVTYDMNVKFDDCIMIDENIFPFNKTMIDERLPYKDRGGWYLQQLIKLYASFVIPEITDTYLVIDADTYFLRPVTFFENGLPIYNYGEEHHKPYFAHMKRLHPTLKRENDMSGVTHHMVFQKHIIQQMFDLVEGEHNKTAEAATEAATEAAQKKPFWRIFIENIYLEHTSGASEYEIYFNYLQIYHPNEFLLRKLHWENSNHIHHNCDYVSLHFYLR